MLLVMVQLVLVARRQCRVVRQLQRKVALRHLRPVRAALAAVTFVCRAVWVVPAGRFCLQAAWAARALAGP